MYSYSISLALRQSLYIIYLYRYFRLNVLFRYLDPYKQGSPETETLIPEPGTLNRGALHPQPYSRSQKVGNPIASILKSNVQGIPALFGLIPVSNFMGFTSPTLALSTPK